jgi:hypothetical protein
MRLGHRLEALETRTLLASPAEVLTYHNDTYSTGQNLIESVLTPANVNPTSFGLAFRTTLDGQVYAQTLYKANVNITRGGAPGIHNVVFAATQHDSLFAVDAESGAVLWQDSFLNITDPTSLTATPGVRTVPAGTSTSTPAQPYDALVSGNDVAPELGIIATPVIDPSSGVLYVVANTQEKRTGAAPSAAGNDVHFVQRLWAVSLSDGAAAISAAPDPAIVPNPALVPASAGKILGDVWKTDVPTFSNYTNYKYFAGAFIKGTGQNGGFANPSGDANPRDGWVVNPLDTTTPWGAAGKTPMQSGNLVFNSLLQMGRPGLTLLNGNLYMAFASHGDEGPYYGWVLGFNAATLANNAAFVTAPTFEPFSEVSGNNGNLDAQAGVWMSGAAMATDGTYLYLTTGNGAFDIKPVNFSASYVTTDNGATVQLPLDNDYGDCVLKLAVDPAANQTDLDLTQPPTVFTPAGKNVNGYGLSVQDFFSPSNALRLNAIDADMGSGGVLLIPDAITSSVPGHIGHHMLVTGGKEGRIYLIDRDNMGGYNTAYPTPVDGSGDPDPDTDGPDPSPWDRVLGEYAVNFVNEQQNQFYSTASYFNNGSPLFYVGLAGLQNWQFNVNTFQAAASPPGSSTDNAPINQTSDTFPRRGTTSAISSNGAADAIVWNLSVNFSSTDRLMAFSQDLGPALYSSSTNSADKLAGTVSGATGVKFSIPTVANGFVYAGTGGGSSATSAVGVGTLVAYGLKAPALHAPAALDVSLTDNTSVHLAWTRAAGDQESVTRIERSTDGFNFTLLRLLGNGTSTYDDANLAPDTHYVYRTSEIYGANLSAPSPTADITTPPDDITAPSASLGGQTPVAGAASLDFTVTYSDSGSGVDAATFGDDDVSVTGPAAFNENASYVSHAGDVVTYRIAAPGGIWNLGDNGLYSINQNAGAVKDNAGNARPAGAIGTFTAAVSFAYLDGSTLELEYDSGAVHPMSIADSGSQLSATHNGAAFEASAAAVSSVIVNGSAFDDVLTYDADESESFTFHGAGGLDAIHINSGTLAFTTDAGADTDGVMLTVAGGASANFNLTQHLGSLAIDGNAALTPGGGNVLVTDALSLGTSARLDLADNAFILHSTAANRAADTAAITALIKSGFNLDSGTLWSGPGMTSSRGGDGASNLHALGVLLDDLAPAGGTGPLYTSFAGENVGLNDVLVRFTWFGDIDLDGAVTTNDYFLIDNGFLASKTGWINGDLDYDGAVTTNDYFVIDNAFLGQTASPESSHREALAAVGLETPIDMPGQ